MAIGAAAAALGAILTVIAQVDGWIPHFVDRDEIEELHEILRKQDIVLAGSINKNTRDNLENQEDLNTGRIYQNQAQIDDARARKVTPSKNLIDEQIYLQEKQRNIRRKLADLPK